jgi:hypothetical protein
MYLQTVLEIKGCLGCLILLLILTSYKNAKLSLESIIFLI